MFLGYSKYLPKLGVSVVCSFWNSFSLMQNSFLLVLQVSDYILPLPPRRCFSLLLLLKWVPLTSCHINNFPFHQNNSYYLFFLFYVFLFYFNLFNRYLFINYFCHYIMSSMRVMPSLYFLLKKNSISNA